MRINNLLVYFLIICILPFSFSCSEKTVQDEKFLYEEIMNSMINSWRLNAVLNIHFIVVYDFVSSGTLNTFLNDDALFFLLPGETCNSCLEREFQKFLDWDIDLDKYILGYNSNSNYLLELKKNHPEIKNIFVIQDKFILNDWVSYPHIIYFRQKTETYLNYASVKSGVNHFDYFKNIVEPLTAQ